MNTQKTKHLFNITIVLTLAWDVLCIMLYTGRFIHIILCILTKLL